MFVGLHCNTIAFCVYKLITTHYYIIVIELCEAVGHMFMYVAINSHVTEMS